MRTQKGDAGAGQHDGRPTTDADDQEGGFAHASHALLAEEGIVLGELLAHEVF
jgi:hypothetical protein